MDTANDNPSTSHQSGASASQPGNISQPENAQLAQAGSFTSQPGENLTITLSDINVNMSTMASLLQSLVQGADDKPVGRKQRYSCSNSESEPDDSK